MEIPLNLKSLYCHWSEHTERGIDQIRNPGEIFLDIALFEHMAWFIGERMNIWKKKISGKSEPYTDDPILQKYRFCNIFREFDRQTIEFHTLLLPLRDDFPLWLLNMFYCRMVARPETMRILGLLSYNTIQNQKLLAEFLKLPRPRFGTPYVFPISTIMRGHTPTRESFITEHLPEVMPKIASLIRTWKKKSVFDGVSEILPVFGYNLSFLWTEVLIDVAYQFPEYINLFDRFPIGPGAAPTFKRINDKYEPSLLARDLACIEFDSGITYDGAPIRLSAENWEGVGCEYRKYTNLKAGRGRKRIYENRESLSHPRNTAGL